MSGQTQQAEDRRGTVAEVFVTFLRLGLTSFGGPVAHLGYFRAECVQRRGWLPDAAYADLVALCQFLPGPASSQTGFALGLMRAGWGGAVAAFIAFTLPSAILMAAFAMTAARLTGPVAEGALAGLKIVAVAIVAQAVIGMARSLCPDGPRATIAALAVALLAVAPAAWGMAAAIALGAAAGLAVLRPVAVSGDRPVALPVPRGVAVAAGAAFVLLLAVLPLAATLGPWAALADTFYRAGALVFGGGHVVLPLLEAEVAAQGMMTQEAFLAGYGAAQAMPGPLFTFAAYLGAVPGAAPAPLPGALVALLALFLPGFLILIAVLPFWDRFRRMARAQAAMQGANAAVVGVLGAALHDPVLVTAVGGPGDLALAVGCLVLLLAWRAPPLLVVVVAVAGGIAQQLIL